MLHAKSGMVNWWNLWYSCFAHKALKVHLTYLNGCTNTTSGIPLQTFRLPLQNCQIRTHTWSSSALQRSSVAAFGWIKKETFPVKTVCETPLQECYFNSSLEQPHRNWAHSGALRVVRKIDSRARSPLTEDWRAFWFKLMHHMTLWVW